MEGRPRWSAVIDVIEGKDEDAYWPSVGIHDLEQRWKRVRRVLTEADTVEVCVVVFLGAGVQELL